MSDHEDTPIVPSDELPSEELTSDNAPGGSQHHSRMRFQWNDLMEDIIEDGRRRGLFDDLPGAGRPLDLQRNIYEGSNTLANQLMKANDIRPAWLSHRMDVEQKVESQRTEIARAWERYRAAWGYAQGDGRKQALAVGWDALCREWQEKLAALNKEIESYNLKRPNGQMELFKLQLDRELKLIDAPRYLV